MKGLGALQRHQLPQPPCKNPGSATGSPYSITERRVPELIPVLCSQPAGDVSHKLGGSYHYFPPGQWRI